MHLNWFNFLQKHQNFEEIVNFELENYGCLFYVSSNYAIEANGNPTLFEPVYPNKKAEGNAPPFAIKRMNKQINNLLKSLTLLVSFVTLEH
jgi:hypothetical protein